MKSPSKHSVVLDGSILDLALICASDQKVQLADFVRWLIYEHAFQSRPDAVKVLQELLEAQLDFKADSSTRSKRHRSKAPSIGQFEN